MRADDRLRDEAIHSPHQSSIAKSVTSFLAQSIASLSSSQERASQSLKCPSCPIV